MRINFQVCDEAMKLYRDITTVPAEYPRMVVTIGNFDGIHRGHQELFARMVKSARATAATAAVLTFDPHPYEVLRPESTPQLITTTEEKIRLIGLTGADILIIQPFTLEFSRLSARDFLTNLLIPYLRPTKIIVGQNFRFGRDKGGGTNYLQEASRLYHFEVDVVPSIRESDATLSSSSIRSAIVDGDVEKAKCYLGRPYSISGHVVKGDNRGHRLGFPTANLETQSHLIPADGVYACLAHVRDRFYSAVINIGLRPTFQTNKRTIEVHMLDFSGDLYGTDLELLFFSRIRPEKRFSSADELKAQISLDIEASRILLAKAEPFGGLPTDSLTKTPCPVFSP